MRFIILSLLTLGFCFAEEPAPKPLPKDVQTIVDSREVDLQAARIAFDKAVFEANKKAIGKMEAVVKTSTQKGDLDGALASKKFVEDWNKEKEAVAVSSGMGGAGPGEKVDLEKKVIGTWIISKGEGLNKRFTFTKNGEWTSSWTELGGTWSIVDKKLIMVSTFGNNRAIEPAPIEKECDWIFNDGTFKVHVKKQ